MDLLPVKLLRKPDKMDAAITKNEYFALRDKLNFRRQFWPTALIMLADLGLIVFAVWLVGLDSWAQYILAQLIFVLVFFHNFAIVHECGHGNCSTNERINTIVGSYASIFCFMPYFPWKYIHAEHHTWAGNVERDPTLRLIRNYEKSQRAKNWVIRFAWRTWLPLLAFMQHVVFWTYPLIRIREGRFRSRQVVNSCLSIALLAVSYTAFYFSMSQWFNLSTFGPALLIYLLVVELINFPHHMGTKLFGTTEEGKKLPLWHQEEVTRSCYYPPIVSNALLMNFNFHVEHHLFPDLPWYNLDEARPLARGALGDRYEESVGIDWSVENRSKDATEVFLKDADEARHWELERDEEAVNTDSVRMSLDETVRIAARGADSISDEERGYEIVPTDGAHS